MTDIEPPNANVTGASNDNITIDNGDFQDARIDDEYSKQGVTPPYTAFKYGVSKRLTNKLSFSKNEDLFFKPMAVFEQIDHRSLGEKPLGTTVYDKSNENQNTSIGRSYPRNDTTNAFCGYFYVPKTTLNTPLRQGVNHESSSHGQHHPNSIGQMAYQNHHCDENSIYSFGGLIAGKGCSFEHLGLPQHVSPDDIIIHFPVELPPYIDRDILISPYLEQNNHLYKYNPVRGTMTVLDSLTSDVPHHLNSMTCTKISDHLAFFYGGFEIITREVKFDSSLNKWIIKKDIIMNDYGYIFDIKILQFTKINLRQQDGIDDFKIGRIGNAIAANEYERSITVDGLPSRPLTPSNLNIDTNHYSPYIPINPKSPVSTPLIKTKSSSSSSNNNANKTVINNKGNTNLEPGTPASGSSSHSGYFKTQINRVATNSSSDSHGSKIQHTKKNINKVFDRVSHLSHPSSPHQVHRQPLPLQSEAANSNALPHTYSEQVKKNRSNSGSLHSRPVSPTPEPVKPLRYPPLDFKDLPIDNETECLSGDNCDICMGNEANQESTGPERSNANVFGEKLVDNGDSLTSIFIFGGFNYEINDGIKVFKANNEMLRIDLICHGSFYSKNFDTEAIVYEIPKLGELWPSPRGFFASSLINYDDDTEEDCQWYDKFTRPLSPAWAMDDESNSSNSIQTSTSKANSKFTKAILPEEYFKKKVLLIQGGCNENRDTFADFYIFRFEMGQWQEFNTFVYNYYNKRIGTNDDDNCLDLVPENEVTNPELVEAELRACHHTALYYNKFGREYVFFVGGFNNNYLRHFDQQPYESDKYDVSRLARFRVATVNFNICRIMVLNVKTQTWGFYRYYYDIRKNMTNDTFEHISGNPEFTNASLAHFGGTVSLNGKIITLCHGLTIPVPEKKEDFEALQRQFPNSSFLWGCHCQFIFPSM